MGKTSQTQRGMNEHTTLPLSTVRIAFRYERHNNQREKRVIWCALKLVIMISGILTRTSQEHRGKDHAYQVLQFRTPDAPEMRQCQTKSSLGDLVCFKTCNLDLRIALKKTQEQDHSRRETRLSSNTRMRVFAHLDDINIF